MNNQVLDEKQIRKVIDLYAVYADEKETIRQVALFTDNYNFEVFYDSTSIEPTQSLSGKENLFQLFTESLSPFNKTMHFNGQSIIEFKSENEANGVLYCRAYHYNNIENTEKIMVAIIKYKDKFQKIDNEWYFSERKLYVQWIENR